MRVDVRLEPVRDELGAAAGRASAPQTLPFGHLGFESEVISRQPTGIMPSERLALNQRLD